MILFTDFLNDVCINDNPLKLIRPSTFHFPFTKSNISFLFTLFPQRKKNNVETSFTFIKLISDIPFSKSYFEILALPFLISVFLKPS